MEEEHGQGLEGGGGGEESWYSRVKGVVNEVMTVRLSECSNITIFLFQEQSHKLDHHYRSQETEYVYFSKLYFAKCTRFTHLLSFASLFVCLFETKPSDEGVLHIYI